MRQNERQQQQQNSMDACTAQISTTTNPHPNQHVIPLAARTSLTRLQDTRQQQQRLRKQKALLCAALYILHAPATTEAETQHSCNSAGSSSIYPGQKNRMREEGTSHSQSHTRASLCRSGSCHDSSPAAV
jgi:hypothetical protein